ncbi:MAG: hypothetical protein ACXAB9_10685 [Candidatus Thorarchaeota archaeon]|jgi:hypothetical protein
MVTFQQDGRCGTDAESVLVWYKTIQNRVRVLPKSKQEDAAQETIARVLGIMANRKTVSIRHINQTIWSTIRSFRGDGKTERLGGRDFLVESNEWDYDFFDFFAGVARDMDDFFILGMRAFGHTQRELALQMEVPETKIRNSLKYLEGCYDRHQTSSA